MTQREKFGRAFCLACMMEDTDRADTVLQLEDWWENCQKGNK
jgi:hypothetical protein